MPTTLWQGLPLLRQPPIANKRAAVIPQPLPRTGIPACYARFLRGIRCGRPNIATHSAGVVPVIKNSRSDAGTFGMQSWIFSPACHRASCSSVQSTSIVFTAPEIMLRRVINIGFLSVKRIAAVEDVLRRRHGLVD